ncbi:ethanolamine utilization protein EutJ [Stomatohabitans albus]|uniref:ethanolamine utilization protein EutJ n=1 Tax=Stomatohabitans albus TaxID=3110766 RepID=UPI00300D6002
MGKQPRSDLLGGKFAALIKSGDVADHDGQLSLGIDLGTANIVLAVVDEHGEPVAGAHQHSTVVRDGIVVDWLGAVRAVQTLKADLEQRIKTTFKNANVAIPPGVIEGTVKVFENVAEAADLQVNAIVDEPVAAAALLGVSQGCVIDIGHGTTGVSVLQDNKVVLSIDQATGGHHVTLVLAGAMGIDYDRAEKMKKSPSKAAEVGAVVRPTLEKMATIARDAIGTNDVGPVYLVGGSAMLPVAPSVFEKVLGREVIRPKHPLWVTPLGLAMSTLDRGGDDGH